MAVLPNASFTFVDYEVVDNGIQLHFICYIPGAGEPNDYYITITDSELAILDTGAKFVSFIEGKLTRRIRKQGIAERLDLYIGRSVTI